MSDASIARANLAAAQVLVDTLAAAGLRHVVVSPGSRSTPLALATGRDPRLAVHVVLDERSAAFYALGIAKASGVAAAALCTSGTAATNYLPAVVEAHHAQVPLVVLTADRPPELRGVGAPQTIDQLHLYGGAVRSFVDLAPPGDSAVAPLAEIARSCWTAAHRAPAGPVHVNAPFREPLVTAEPSDASAPDPAPGEPAPAAGAARTPGADPDRVAALADLVDRVERGLVVAGWGPGVDSAVVDAFCAATGWPLLADPISGLRSESSVRCYDAMIRHEGFAAAHAPQAVVRLGAPPTSKALATWLGRHAVPHVLVSRPGPVLDPDRLATDVVTADPASMLADLAARVPSGGAARATRWHDDWAGHDAAVAALLDEALDDGVCAEGRVARDVVAAAPAHGIVGVASSMPVRDVDAFAPARTDVTFVANRGANGIDGFTSTILGSAATGRPAVGLVGDLCFLHDTNGLLAAAASDGSAVLVVVDNDGGGIFEFLPQAEHIARPEFERLFGAPHGLDLVAVAQAHGVAARRCSPDEVADVAGASGSSPGVEVVVVSSDRRANVADHRRLQAMVGELLGGRSDHVSP